MNVNNLKFSVYNSVYSLLILSIIHIFVDNFIKNFDLLWFSPSNCGKLYWKMVNC